LRNLWRFPRWLACALTAAAVGTVAEAEPIAVCALPSSTPAVSIGAPPPDQVQTKVRTAAYVLALTWAPEFCRTHGDQRDDDIECRDNRFGFVVHGLWPNGPARVHPRFCHPARAVDGETVRANLCMTPSVWLLQHEWAAHGTCGWATPEAYFAKAHALRTGLDVPRLKPGPGEMMKAGEVRGAFLALNRRLNRQELDLDVDKDQRLQEVLICYDLAFRPAHCLHGIGVPDGASIRVTPLS
jgi:ribonuclease T2